MSQENSDLGIAEAKQRIQNWIDRGDKYETLDLSTLELKSLPKIPDNVSILDCSKNKLTSLPHLPNNLGSLDCSVNNLGVLPDLPPTLLSLICSHTGIINLPKLPDTLKKLDCSDNKLDDFSTLPSKLRTLIVQHMGLTSIPKLPNSLINLNCSDNNLETLPDLSNTKLFRLDCYDNKLIQLPKLPDTIRQLHCYNNKLTSLPELPNLEGLNFSDNNVKILGKYPKLTDIHCSGNKLGRIGIYKELHLDAIKRLLFCVYRKKEGKNISEYYKQQFNPYAINDLSNIMAGYIDDDKCSMLTWNGERCLLESEFTKTIEGEKYKINCKKYCQEHCQSAFRPLFEQPPKIVTFNKRGTNEYIDYLVTKVLVGIIIKEEGELNYVWNKEDGGSFHITERDIMKITGIGRRQFDDTKLCELLKEYEKTYVSINIEAIPINKEDQQEMDDLKRMLENKDYNHYDPYLSGKINYDLLHTGSIDNLDNYKFLFFKDNELKNKRWLSSVWNITNEDIYYNINNNQWTKYKGIELTLNYIVDHHLDNEDYEEIKIDLQKLTDNCNLLDKDDDTKYFQTDFDELKKYSHGLKSNYKLVKFLNEIIEAANDVTTNKKSEDGISFKTCVSKKLIDEIKDYVKAYYPKIYIENVYIRNKVKNRYKNLFNDTL